MKLSFWRNGSPFSSCLLQGMTRRQRHRRSRMRQVTTSAEVMEERILLSVYFTFDYSLDTNGFFADQARRDMLELAAENLTSRLSDTLDPIEPSGSNHWYARFSHPATWEETSNYDFVVDADEIYVYVGGYDIVAHPALFSKLTPTIDGDAEWWKDINGRGEPGRYPTSGSVSDFATWGGSISFSTGKDWHFGATTEGLDEDEYDFLSVATRQLALILGFGHATSWDVRVRDNEFTGANAVAEYDGSGNIPLRPNATLYEVHLFADGVSDLGQESLLAHNAILGNWIDAGERRELTELGFAALKDIGWEVAGLPTQTIDLEDGTDHTIVLRDDGVTGNGFIEVVIDSDVYSVHSPTQTLIINGGDQDDTITIEELDSQFVADIEFYGNGGDNVATLHATTDVMDTFVAYPTHQILTVGTRYQIDTYNVSEVTLENNDANNVDAAYLHDGDGNDFFEGSSTVSVLYGTHSSTPFSYEINDFYLVKGFGASGGTNIATFYATTGLTETFLGYPAAQSLSADSVYSVTTEHFSRTVVENDDANNADLAYLFSGNQSASYVGTPTMSKLSGTHSGTPFIYEVNNFLRVRGFNGTSGDDVANIYGTSDVSDTFVGNKVRCFLATDSTGATDVTAAYGFRVVHLNGDPSDSDYANLFATTGLNEIFDAQPVDGVLKSEVAGSDYYIHARNMRRVIADSYDTNNADIAVLYDNAAGDDTLHSTDSYTRLYGTISGKIYENRAKGFSWLRAFSAGGYDTANFTDSAAAETFTILYFDASSIECKMLRGTRLNYARGFDCAVAAFDQGGDDTVRIEGAKNNDVLSYVGATEADFDTNTTSQSVKVTNLGLGDELSAFAAVGQTPSEDISDHLNDIDFAFSTEGSWN